MKYFKLFVFLFSTATCIASAETGAFRLVNRSATTSPAATQDVAPETDITIRVVQNTEAGVTNVQGLPRHMTLEEVLGYIGGLAGRDLGEEENSEVQEVALEVLQAKQAGKEKIEDTATVALLNKLLEKYPVNKSRTVTSVGNSGVAHTAGGDITAHYYAPIFSLEGGSVGTRSFLVREEVRRTQPAIVGFGALGTHHSNHSPEWRERRRFRGLRGR